MIQIDANEVERMLARLQREVTNRWKSSGEHFKNLTPVRTGNARNRTSTTDTRIRADYGYAGPLDEGSSRQAPGGMSNPTIDYFDNQIDRLVRNSNG